MSGIADRGQVQRPREVQYIVEECVNKDSTIMKKSK